MLIIEVLNTESESNSVIIDLGLNSESKMFERFASWQVEINSESQLNPATAHFKELVKIMLYTEGFFFCHHMNNHNNISWD